MKKLLLILALVACSHPTEPREKDCSLEMARTSTQDRIRVEGGVNPNGSAYQRWYYFYDRFNQWTILFEWGGPLKTCRVTRS